MTQVSRIDGQVMREINVYLPLLPGKSKLSMFKSVTKKCQTWKLDNEALMMHEQKTAKNDITSINIDLDSNHTLFNRKLEVFNESKQVMDFYPGAIGSLKCETFLMKHS